MSVLGERLLTRLVDGRLHSGEELAAQLAVTRTTIWNLVGELRSRGIGIESVDRLIDAARVPDLEHRPHDLHVVLRHPQMSVPVPTRYPGAIQDIVNLRAKTCSLAPACVATTST